MRCSTTKKRLAEYIYGDLRDREAREIRSHLESCTSCRETAIQVKGILSLVSAYGETSPPSEVHAGLREEVAARSGERRLRFSLLNKPIPAYAAATTIAILAVLSGISTRMEISRLERMNSLLSDSLRILNSRSAASPHSQLPDSTGQDTLPTMGRGPSTGLRTGPNF
jgi:anti-sigma factor RsiW